MRGEQESRCLGWVREHLYGPETRFFCRDRRKAVRMLEGAKPNDAPSQFPDFVFEDGFIEHFQITASQDTRKGSDHQRARSEFKRDMGYLLEEQKQELEQAEPPKQHRVTVISCDMKSPKYSYEMYQKAFRKHWEHHIHSLESYTGPRENGIFLVEYQGALLKIVRHGQFVDFYQLHIDAAMLRYMEAYRDRLSYVVFVDNRHCEVIELQQIPDLIERVPGNISFEPGRYREINLIVSFDLASTNENRRLMDEQT